MPIFAYLVMPKDLNSWLSRFKKQDRIKQFVLYGMSGSVGDAEETVMLVREAQDVQVRTRPTLHNSCKIMNGNIYII